MVINKKAEIQLLKYRIGLKEVSQKINIFPAGKFKKKHYEKK